MENFFNYKQARICYTDEGRGKCVVLLHGFLETKEIWKDLSEILSKRYRVITVDLPGHGKSDCIGYVHPMELMADCLKKLLNKLRVRKMVIAGHSMGGYVSLAFADYFADNLRGLALVHSTAREDTSERKKSRERSIEAAKNNHVKFATSLIENLFAPDNRKPLKQVINGLKKQAEKVSVRAIINCLEGMKERPNREVILKFTPFPILIIGGKNDEVIPVDTLVEQTKLSEKIKLVTLEKSGHMGMYEEREKFLKVFYDFIKSCK